MEKNSGPSNTYSAAKTPTPSVGCWQEKLSKEWGTCIEQGESYSSFPCLGVDWHPGLPSKQVSFFKKNSTYLSIIFGFTGSLAVSGLSLAAVSGAALQLRCRAIPCGGFSCGALTLGPVGFSSVAHQFSCLATSGIFPDHGLNWCTLHWPVGS